MMKVDVRSPQEFEAGHVRGAVNIPLETLLDRIEDLRAVDKLELLCWTSARAKLAAGTLRSQGIECEVVEGGTKAWMDAGNALVGTHKGKAGWGLDRQIRFIIGAMLLPLSLAVAGGWTAAVWLLVTLGVLVTGTALLGICPMGLFLMRMPWNRR